MSGAIDRLRRTVAAVFARPDDAISVGYGDVVAALSALDEYAHVERALREERVAERARADAAEADRDYWHAQATMAAPCVDAVRALTLRLIPGGTGCAVDPERVVAAVDGLRAECDRIDRLASRQAGEYMEAAHDIAIERDAARRAATFAEMERDTLRGLTDAMRADNVRLRGIVAGRETAPTDAELTAHHDEGGQWLVIRAASPRSIVDTLRSVTDVRAWARSGTPLRWLPLDASGRPCPWPTVAAEAATGAAR